MKILFLAPYPKYESPSQRYRFEHYLGELEKKGIAYNYIPFLSLKAWKIVFQPGHYFQKAISLLVAFAKRWALMFRLRSYTHVYIHREAAPIGPPVFEWIIKRLWKKKLIYDYDDAIWIPVTSEHNKMALRFKWFSKVATICRLADTVSAGNEFLADFARRYCKNVIVIPTVVETDSRHNARQNQETDKPAIGWTGTFSTLKYLDIVKPVLQELQAEIEFTFIVIANEDPKLPLKHYQFIPWNKETEISDLLKMHIGLMPLYDGDLEKGKCGFKAIQYMSLGIPAVVSAVGVNDKIVEDGVNGFVCHSQPEWKEKLRQLLLDKNLRAAFGAKARTKIENEYSVKSTSEKFVALFGKDPY